MKTIASLVLLFPTMAFAGSSLPLKLAHEKGFVGCDAAITKAFAETGGDIRVNVSQVPDTHADTLRLTATSGNPGDSIFVDAEFRRLGSKCFYSQTAIITSEKSCIAYKEENPAFRFVAQSTDFTWTQNSGGVLLLLKSVGSGCVAIFETDQ